MNVVLLRVGIDTGSGGIYGPLFRNGSFELIPILDNKNVDKKTYSSIIGEYGRKLIDYFPKSRQNAMANRSVHLDPEFETFTYGDPISTKACLSNLKKNDLLVFYAGLQGWDFDSQPALYLVGYFEVFKAGMAGDFSKSELDNLFSKNFHVRHGEVDTDKKKLVLVKGTQNSRLLKKAVLISAPSLDSSGRSMYIVSDEMKKIFGEFSGKGSIQRSYARYVVPEYTNRAAEFVKSLI